MSVQTTAGSIESDSGDWFALTPMQTALISEGVGTDKPWINLEQVVVTLPARDIDAEILCTVWQAIAQRHATLRLVLDWRAAPAVQRCLATMAPVVRLRVCPEVTAQQRQNFIEEFLAADRLEGVALVQAPGWRVTVLRFDDDACVMVWTIHHALVDGRSMARIIAEALVLLVGGTLADAPASQGGFQAHAQMITAGAAVPAAAAGYFKDYLADFGDAGVLALPENTAKPALPPHKQVLERSIPPAVHVALTQQASTLDATVGSLVQTAWGLVLARWSGRSDVSFGTVRSGRHGTPAAAETAGCFINTLPLRLRLDPAQTLATIVRQIRRATLDMHPFEQASVSLIRRASGLDGRQPLFNSVVMFERASFEAMVRHHVPLGTDHRIELREEGGAALSLSVYADAQMRIVLEHDAAYVAGTQAALLLDHLVNLLSQMAQAAPDTPVGQIPMLDAAEDAHLRALAKPATPLGPVGGCLVRNFLDVVAKTPDASAVEVAGAGESEAGRLTYARLDHWANGIAAQLGRSGIGAGDVVAIRLARSPAFIAAIFGVLKCGAVFVPVDPTYPAPLQAHMLADSGAKVVICTTAAPDSSGLTVIDPQTAQRSEFAPALPDDDPDQLAYILYTSGSTGQPKGVEVTRRNLLSHIAALTTEFALYPEDRVLQFASLSFDVALEEVFPTLMAGATLILRTADMAQSAAVFLEQADDLRLSVANLPTAFWHVLTDYIMSRTAAVPVHLRLLVVGGELPAAGSLRAWRAAAPHVRWLCGYGPTEATITCTVFEADDSMADADVPIGRPTAHARAYVLAADHSLAPKGAEGVLAIGGAAVARGYVGRPAQTAEVFRPDPFMSDPVMCDPSAPAARMYLSGDRVRWLASGNLGFLGRTDRQIKLRGYRIDLRQIERAVEARMAGLHVLASVLDEGTPAVRLVAWVTGATLPDLPALKEAAAQVLAPHMQPHFVVLEQFPRTAGGKIDMAALPVPQAIVAAALSHGIADALADEVALIMAALLGQPQVGADQSFYDLGGHSLLMIDLIGRLEGLAGVRLGPAEFYENPTPRHLAQLLRRGSAAPKHIIPIQPGGRHPPLFAVHILGINEEYFRPLSRKLGPDQPVMGVSLASLGPDAPIGIVSTAARYCEDINTYYPEGPIRLIAVSLASYLAIELAHQLRATGRDVASLAIIDAAGPGGRQEVTGLRRLFAHLRRAKYIGRDYPRQILRNRIYDLRVARAARVLRRSAREGNVPAPATAAQFDASNEAAVDQYTPQAIHIPLIIFRAASNFFDTRDGITSGLGWAEIAKAGFEVIDVSGTHLSILQDPNVATIAKRLKNN